MYLCISVSEGLLGYASPMFTTPVGFTDHSAVVLQFVGMGMDGVQHVRWKFPQDALQHEDTVVWNRVELLCIHDSGFCRHDTVTACPSTP